MIKVEQINNENLIVVTFKIPAWLLHQVDVYCANKKINRSEFIRNAIMKTLKEG